MTKDEEFVVRTVLYEITRHWNRPTKAAVDYEILLALRALAREKRIASSTL